jgi:hypothetical protein
MARRERQPPATEQNPRLDNIEVRSYGPVEVQHTLTGPLHGKRTELKVSVFMAEAYLTVSIKQ